MEGFDYVIKRPQQAKVCFGSTIQRDAVPLTGPAKSSIMRRTTNELTGENLSPGTYDITYYDHHSHPILKSGHSIRGRGSLSATSVRFKHDEVCHLSAAGDYHVITKPLTKPCWSPFGATVPRWMETEYPAVPGPGTYTQKKRKEIRMYSFGGRIKIIPAAITTCKTENFDKCYRCDQKPEIDYWKNEKTEKSLCRACMQKEINLTKIHSKTKSVMLKQLDVLKEFRRIRHCAYYHTHDKTTAAVQFRSNRDLKQKFRVENYLSMYE
ncbi:uncharacterized protein LOC131436450 [Malaya genurostris]|uniref:uncharacterized protein LOC131436450 n=1 Tax=Malaya genurostris TaxID=325434 RepID=UPI0026F3B36C|nr:uncharacterized protein LOC131436450 [Malaya genurostris]